MLYHSLKDASVKAKFGEALLASLAPGGGLWMPDSLPHYNEEQLAKLGAMSFGECAVKLARHFTDSRFTDEDLEQICGDAYNFPVPIRTADGYHLDPAMAEDKNDYFLELFHGPTLAFKDFAARFMGRAASHLLTKSGERRTILVATSGDTGGAIGYSFLNQAGIKVYILYPKGGVSSVQEQQLTTMGGNSNVKAICVDGTFDDCQQLVKDAFADDAMSEAHQLMSANSINVGRVIPQSFYYFWTSLQLKAAHPERPLVYSIPSGNLGNLTGGLIAKQMGAPIDRFVVGNNTNDPFVDYLASGEYTPRPSVPTLSNAMDIGRPNNFPRISALYEDNYDAVKTVCFGASFDDLTTERHLRRYHGETGYVMCPHTTVGHLAMEQFKADVDEPFTQVTVATAHPAKFRDDVERIIREEVPMPDTLAVMMDKSQVKHVMEPTLSALGDYLDKTA